MSVAVLLLFCVSLCIEEDLFFVIVFGSVKEIEENIFHAISICKPKFVLTSVCCRIFSMLWRGDYSLHQYMFGIFPKFQHGIRASSGSLKVSKKLKKKTCCSVFSSSVKSSTEVKVQVFLKDNRTVVFCLTEFVLSEKRKDSLFKFRVQFNSNGWTKYRNESWKCATSTI